MSEGLEELRVRVEALTRELAEMRRRVSALESRLEPAAQAADSSPATVAAPEPIVAALPAGVVAFVGRTLVVLAGAYFLRALTESGLLPAWAGVAAGFAYAGFWLLRADRAVGAGRRLAGTFHGYAAVMIAFPLLWETALRFKLLGPGAAAAAIGTAFAIALGLAFRRGLPELAWSATLAALADAVGLMVATQRLMPFALLLLAMGAALEGLAYRERWLGLRWPVALALDLAVFEIVAIALRADGPPEGYVAWPLPAVVALALLLPALYLTGAALRTLRLLRGVTVFEGLQCAAALWIGLFGAASVLAFAGSSSAPVGVCAALLGAGGYATAFAFVDRRSGQGRNFYAYSTLGGALLLAGTRLVVDGAPLALAWCTLALAATSAGRRFGRVTLRFHGVVYLAAASIEADLLAAAAHGLWASAGSAWQPVGPAAVIATLTAACGYAVLIATRATDAGRAAQWPRALTAALLAFALAGLCATALGRLLAGASGPAADAAFVAAARTAVLAALAVLLAWAGGRFALRELTWLVYPVLVGGGLKLLAEDFRHGRPLTLFLTLGLYGGALIATPRLLSRGREPAA